jgi:peptidoglycan/xylan/chitin deacetylase (PgdA/CDA1 family)
VPILCYHSVDPTWESNLCVTPKAFEQQCRWLKCYRAPTSLGLALAQLDTLGDLPSNLTAITFDDGLADFYEHAFPILRRERLPCTVFLVAGTLVRQEPVADWIDEPQPHPHRLLSLDQVLEMKEAGIQFGSHSYAHHDLTTLSEYECILDLRESRELLESLLNTKITVLAYPRGKHNERVRRAAERAGFTHAVAMMRKPHAAGPYSIPRVGVYRQNGILALGVKSSQWYVPTRSGNVFSAIPSFIQLGGSSKKGGYQQ